MHAQSHVGLVGPIVKQALAHVSPDSPPPRRSGPERARCARAIARNGQLVWLEFEDWHTHALARP